VVLFALAAILGTGAPSGAAKDDRTVAERRADAAAKLKAAEATDAELEEAAALLSQAEKAASTKAQAATRAAHQAEEDAKAAEDRLAATSRVITDRAITAYSHGGFRIELGSDPITASRRIALSRIIDARVVDALDEHRAARSDLERRRKSALNAAKTAATALDNVTASRERAGKARDDVQRRISGLEAEISALDAEEANVRRIIASAPPSASVAAAPSGSSGSGYAWPLNGRTTSEFGPRWGRMHKGLDIAAPSGTPIKASKAGTVIHAGWQGGYGNLTIIDHGGGYATAYGHQSRLGSPRGATVRQGEVIGYVGSTGHSTGPHCHFEVRVNGVQQNPRRYLP
jgi:murein DD-endopeptidase MepM/ murein hydrolase activator NlpD